MKFKKNKYVRRKCKRKKIKLEFSLRWFKFTQYNIRAAHWNVLLRENKCSWGCDTV